MGLLISVIKQELSTTYLESLAYLYSLNYLEPVPVAARSAAARLLGFWVRIPKEAWMSVYSECCMLSGRGLCDELITRECDLETS
jgi:hypothetical protein